VDGVDGVELGFQTAVAGGVVFTGTDDGALHAFAAPVTDRQPVSPVDRQHRQLGSQRRPRGSGGQLYVGTADGPVIAYGLP